jgi:hypothetical protein
MNCERLARTDQKIEEERTVEAAASRRHDDPNVTGLAGAKTPRDRIRYVANLGSSFQDPGTRRLAHLGVTAKRPGDRRLRKAEPAG